MLPILCVTIFGVLIFFLFLCCLFHFFFYQSRKDFYFVLIRSRFFCYWGVSPLLSIADSWSIKWPSWGSSSQANTRIKERIKERQNQRVSTAKRWPGASQGTVQKDLVVSKRGKSAGQHQDQRCSEWRVRSKSIDWSPRQCARLRVCANFFHSTKDIVVKDLTSLNNLPQQIIKGVEMLIWDIQLSTLEDCMRKTRVAVYLKY